MVSSRHRVAIIIKYNEKLNKFQTLLAVYSMLDFNNELK